jgi:hypothetical protein
VRPRFRAPHHTCNPIFIPVTHAYKTCGAKWHQPQARIRRHLEDLVGEISGFSHVTSKKVWNGTITGYRRASKGNRQFLPPWHLVSICKGSPAFICSDRPTVCTHIPPDMQTMCTTPYGAIKPCKDLSCNRVVHVRTQPVWSRLLVYK